MTFSICPEAFFRSLASILRTFQYEVSTTEPRNAFITWHTLPDIGLNTFEKFFQSPRRLWDGNVWILLYYRKMLEETLLSNLTLFVCSGCTATAYFFSDYMKSRSVWKRKPPNFIKYNVCFLGKPVTGSHTSDPSVEPCLIFTPSSFTMFVLGTSVLLITVSST